jgi:hypothetical protein
MSMEVTHGDSNFKDVEFPIALPYEVDRSGLSNSDTFFITSDHFLLFAVIRDSPWACCTDFLLEHK